MAAGAGLGVLGGLKSLGNGGAAPVAVRLAQGLELSRGASSFSWFSSDVRGVLVLGHGAGAGGAAGEGETHHW
jgi:hypothetical protein